jgi:hypothetical protein
VWRGERKQRTEFCTGRGRTEEFKYSACWSQFLESPSSSSPHYRIEEAVEIMWSRGPELGVLSLAWQQALTKIQFLEVGLSAFRPYSSLGGGGGGCEYHLIQKT